MNCNNEDIGEDNDMTNAYPQMLNKFVGKDDVASVDWEGWTSDWRRWHDAAADVSNLFHPPAGPCL